MGSVPGRGSNLCYGMRTKSVTNSKPHVWNTWSFIFVPFIHPRCTTVSLFMFFILLFSFPYNIDSEVNWFFFKFRGVQWDWAHLNVIHCLAYCTSPRWWWGWTNRNTRREPAPSVTLFTTNPTWPGSEPGHPGGKWATDGLSYGAVTPDTCTGFPRRRLEFSPGELSVWLELNRADFSLRFSTFPCYSPLHHFPWAGSTLSHHGASIISALVCLESEEIINYCFYPYITV
jgi:hypothetical protein